MRRIEEVRGLNDPQKSYKWDVKLPTFGNINLKTSPDTFINTERQRLFRLAGEEINQRASSVLGGPLEVVQRKPQPFDPSFYIKEVQGLTLPNVEREAFYEGGRETYFPSGESINSFTLVFYQDASKRVPNYIFDWKRKIVHEDGTKGLPAEYKNDITIKLRNGLNVVVYEMILQGCFPTIHAGWNLNSQSENLELTQEFSCDRMIIGSVREFQADPKQQIQDRLKSKTRQVVNAEAGFGLIGVDTL